MEDRLPFATANTSSDSRTFHLNIPVSSTNRTSWCAEPSTFCVPLGTRVVNTSLKTRPTADTSHLRSSCTHLTDHSG
eukprot:1946223-Pleurochrysis_carterae.AAC.1